MCFRRLEQLIIVHLSFLHTRVAKSVLHSLCEETLSDGSRGVSFVASQLAQDALDASLVYVSVHKIDTSVRLPC
jgi:hypothetical protein